jgi:hypothetical protein
MGLKRVVAWRCCGTENMEWDPRVRNIRCLVVSVRIYLGSVVGWVDVEFCRLEDIYACKLEHGDVGDGGWR